MGKFVLATPAEKSFWFYDNVLHLKGVLLFLLLLLFVSLDRFTSTQVGLEFGVLWRMTLNSRVLVLQLWYQIV